MSDYAYAQPQRLVDRKPYSFAPYGGPALLRSHARSRAELLGALIGREGELRPSAQEAWLRPWLERLEEPGLLLPASPMPGGELSEMLRAARKAWERRVHAEGADTAITLEELLTPFLQSWRAVRRNDLELAWTRDVLETLLRRFEAFGQVYRRYDHRWRKADVLANPPAAVARLSLVAAWLAVGDLEDDLPASLAHLNVLLKINDLLAAGVLHGGWKLPYRDGAWARGGLLLERHLVGEWSRRKKVETA